jgi:hypothetical protein
MNNPFVTLANLQECEGRFSSFLASQHGMTFETPEQLKALRQGLYRAMLEVDKRRQVGDSLRSLNNQAINKALAAMLGDPEGRPQGQRKPTSDTLQRRDLELYGMRQLSDRVPVPTSTSDARRAEVVAATHQAQLEARSLPAGPKDVARASEVVPALGPEDFEARLEQLTAARMQTSPEMSSLSWEAGMPQNMQNLRPAAEADPTVLYAADMMRGAPDADADADAERTESRTALLLPPPSGDTAVVITKYISIHAADRDYVAHPLRFKFTARTTGTQDGSSLTGTYRDVAWMEATNLILPMEIVSAQGSLLNTKPFYRTEFSLAYQYVLLALEGFDALYDGTNEVLRKAFTMFLYERDYKAPNGRGYVVLRPAQEERRCFPTPIASLRDINVSILKPNGTLFNNSGDTYTASHFEYETSNRMYLKVILDQYYDRNELFVGDSVMFRNLAVERKAGGPTYVAAFQAFVNRPQGHEIVQVGASNDQGFVNAIYILAPGMLDTSVGRVIIDEQILTVVAALGQGPDDPAALVEVTSPAKILNMSLQPVLTMRVGCNGGFRNMASTSMMHP